eukprot:COSAG01_NODE_1102_length_11682_cov_11.201848_5_plen_475_part_00
MIANQDNEKFALVPVQTQLLVVGISFAHAVVQSVLHKFTDNARNSDKMRIQSAVDGLADDAESGTNKDGYAELSVEPLGRDNFAANRRVQGHFAHRRDTMCSWKRCGQAVSVSVLSVSILASCYTIMYTMQTPNICTACLLALLMVLLATRTYNECEQIYNEVLFAGVCEADPLDMSSPTRDKITQCLRKHQPKMLADLDTMIRKYGEEHLWEMIQNTHMKTTANRQRQTVDMAPAIRRELQSIQSTPRPQPGPELKPQSGRKGWGSVKAGLGPESNKVAQSVLQVVGRQRLVKRNIANSAKLIELRPLIDQLRVKMEPILEPKGLDWDEALPIVERIGCDSRREGRKMLQAALSDPDSFGEVVLSERHDVARVLQRFWAQYSLEKTRKEHDVFAWTIFISRLKDALSDYFSFWNMIDLVSMGLLWQLMYYAANAGHRLDVMDMLASTASLLLVIRSCELASCLVKCHGNVFAT